jgi:hypothetical protein
MANGQPVVIRELEGDRRTVLLQDADMPDQGIDVAGELREVSTEYPGSSRRSTQIMGTSEQPIELKGRLLDSLMGIDGHAISMMTALRKVYLGQRYCELAWGSTLVRRGYLKRASFRVIRDGDIEYQLTFNPDEADEAEVIAVPQTPLASSRDAITAIDAALVVVDTMDGLLDTMTALDALI